jgi:hypothetical protein
MNKTNQTRSFIPPGTFITQKVVRAANGLPVMTDVKSVIVYTDYDNVLLRYGCGKLARASDLFTYFFIAVRDRKFANQTVFSEALQRLRQIDETQIGSLVSLVDSNSTQCK